MYSFYKNGNRDGSQHDVKNLVSVFKFLQFEFFDRKEYHENLSMKEVEELTQKFIEHPDPIARFYIIMSHGTQTELMDRYSMWFDYNAAILSKFTSANAQHLQDVQKCVVINTNRYHSENSTNFITTRPRV